MTQNPRLKTVVVALRRERLYNTLRAVEPFVCGDVTRPHLTGVLFEISPGTLDIVATDGHRIVHAAPTLGDMGAEPKGSTRRILVDLEQLKALRQSLKCRKLDGAREVTIVASKESLEVSFAGQTITCSDKGATFPSWRKVLPAAVRGKAEKPASSVIVHSDYLEAAAKAARTFGCEALHINAILGDRTPIRLDAEHEDSGSIVVVVMPRRF